jgi:hypothetical protein
VNETVEIDELRDYLGELDFPADADTVDERVGDVTVGSPDTEEELTIGEVLEPLGVERYEDPDELFETVQANLPAEYVGRQGYTDRGGNVRGADADGEGGNGE